MSHFNLTHSLPRKFWVAVSGGIDSMAVLNFLNKPARQDALLGILHVNHNTGAFADEAHNFVRTYQKHYGIRAEYHVIDGHPPQGQSKEAWWRDQRYSFFHSFNGPVILAHNFDDCLEEYIMCTMVRGYSSTIPYRNGNCIRPFRLWKREGIKQYMEKFGHKWVEDPTNFNTNYKRNYIRHELVPRIKELNPGVYNIVERLVHQT